MYAYTSGHSWKISKCTSKLKVRKYFFSERVLNRWNKLSQDDANGFITVLERRRKVEIDFMVLLARQVPLVTSTSEPLGPHQVK